MPPSKAFDARRPSQVSEIDSLVTVAEYNGTQCDGYRLDGSHYELSAAKQKDTPLAGEGTIGSLASEIQILQSNRRQDTGQVQGFPLFTKNNKD